MRSSGILMHISSLPSPYGIGTMGKAARQFADFLHKAGQHYWQLLPLGQTGFGNSPYQTCSIYAGNPYFIDLDELVDDGLLLSAEVQAIDWASHAERVDYDFQSTVRFDLLYRAFRRGADRYEREISAFRQEEPWVEEYALFLAVRRSRGGESWERWPEELRLRRRGVKESYATVLAEDMNFFIFLQFLFYRQWNALRDYVHGLGIEMIGDLPIYVPYDSCDVWAKPALFQMDGEGKPTAVAGCPPDYFSEDGQLWGNPLYNWDVMRADGYAWWMARIRAAAKLFDVVRIDHFRSLESYWAVPYGDKTAKNGKWVKGPGYDFIAAVQKNFPDLHLIAEDLGLLTPEVVQLQRDSGYPGMKVLEFAFTPEEPSNYLPHRYECNCICYTGTHDNETLAQWLAALDGQTTAYVMEYLGVSSKQELHWGLLRAGMASVADTFIAQLQDYLELGEQARMNTPGTVGAGNWTWRMEKDALTDALAARIARMTRLYERAL